jgi:hypothetical protein
MKYNLFIDESGDHGLSNLNPDFPIFLLCGIVISSEEYERIRIGFNEIKQTGPVENRAYYFSFKRFQEKGRDLKFSLKNKAGFTQLRSD